MFNVFLRFTNKFNLIAWFLANLKVVYF